jgi:hypothetical protein
VQGTLGRLTQILRASSIVTTGSDEYVDLMRFGYAVEFRPVGEEDQQVGAPSQMGVFRL